MPWNRMWLHTVQQNCFLVWCMYLILIAFLNDFNCVLSQIHTFSVLLVLCNCSSLLKRHSILCFVHKSSESSGESALMCRQPSLLTDEISTEISCTSPYSFIDLLYVLQVLIGTWCLNGRKVQEEVISMVLSGKASTKIKLCPLTKFEEIYCFWCGFHWCWLGMTVYDISRTAWQISAKYAWMWHGGMMKSWF